MHVKIADLKAHLSEHLRMVRGGSSITVLDRDTPVARLVPYAAAGERLVVRPRAAGRTLRDARLPSLPSRPDDVVGMLLEERQADR